MNIIKHLIKKIKQAVFACRLKKAVKEANELSELFKMRYYVLLYGGKIRIVPKRTIKELIAKKRFKRGTTIEMIEKRALYITK